LKWHPCGRRIRSRPEHLNPLAGNIIGGPGTNDPENVRYERVPFQQLIMAAYGVQRDQIKGPDWATTEDMHEAARFDISAKVPPGTTKDQAAKMLQNLLAERFWMSLQHETVQVSGYAVVVAKGGSKHRGFAVNAPGRQCSLARSSETGVQGSRTGQTARLPRAKRESSADYS